MAVGYNILIEKIMKRYIYILLSALGLLCACTPESQPKPDVAFHWSTVEVETTSDTATIVSRAYITVDGLLYDETQFYLEYALANEDEYIRGAFYEPLSDGRFQFTLSDLEPNTSYKARIVIDGGKYGSETGSPFPFTTKESACEISYNATPLAKGITATITLNDVAYLADGLAQEIESVTVEYALKTSAPEWIEVDATNKPSITIPEDGEEYLEEKSKYLYRVTIEPKSSEYKAITSEQHEFETQYAEVTADISKPNVAIVESNIEVEVESVKVLFDGIELTSYPYLEYYVYYREQDAENSSWQNKCKAEVTEHNINLSLDLASFVKGKSYEFAAAVIAGAEKRVCLSEITTIAIPEEDTPTPPTPPVGGDADTSAIAGCWHLSQWRGSEPSFDIYLSITNDGVVSLYQRLTSREWELYHSTVNYANGIISGVYSDGVAWSTSYSVTATEESMTWIDTADSTDISIYTRAELPADVNATQSVETRGGSAERFL